MNDEKIFFILKKVKLFDGLSGTDIKKALDCLDGKSVKYRKGAVIIAANDLVSDIDIVLNGSVEIMKEDYKGSRSIISRFYPSSIFGEALACAGIKKSPVTALAASNCDRIKIPISHTTRIGPRSRALGNRIPRNLCPPIARSSLFLTR